jgi:hypothetical protein
MGSRSRSPEAGLGIGPVIRRRIAAAAERLVDLVAGITVALLVAILVAAVVLLLLLVVTRPAAITGHRVVGARAPTAADAAAPVATATAATEPAIREASHD